MFNIITIGINHRTAPLNARERMWFSADEIRSILPTIKNKWFSECFFLSTCNRTELYGIPQGTNGNFPSVETVGKFLIDSRSAKGLVELEQFRLLSGVRAAGHLFRVTSGVDSMVVGDVQILNQMKEAYNIATELQTVGIFLNRLLQSAFRVGKRARTETLISEGAVSISYAAVELAGRIFEDLSKKSAILIGAGETGELTAKHLTAKGIGKLVISNRTRSKAEELARSLGGQVADFEKMTEELAFVDVAITSVESPQHILTASQIGQIMRRRANKPLFIIDIGVPRNVEPIANTIENVFLNNLDALGVIVDQNLQKRKTEIAKVNGIILEELADFSSWYGSLEAAPTIGDLHTHFEDIRRKEVEQHMNRFSSTKDKELLDLVTKRIVNKLLHVPTTALKNGHEEPDEVKRKRIHIVRTLFGLNKNADEA